MGPAPTRGAEIPGFQGYLKMRSESRVSVSKCQRKLSHWWVKAAGFCFLGMREGLALKMLLDILVALL